ncbi:MAG: ribosome maturation factor RimM [Deltaproteobacteria bacterium]|jgi:16S rRNA processing protein RimM|nr:ribosome maturation factor RimM [Deltaproteobacteria bacterium]
MRSSNTGNQHSPAPGKLPELIEVGRVVKAHGIRGELCLDYQAESLRLLKDFIYLRGGSALAGAPKAAGTVKYKILSMRQHQGRPLLLLEGVADRNAAELLRNFAVLVPQSRLPKLRPDEVFLSELPGLRVLVRQADGPDEFLGTLASVDEVAGQEIWTINGPNDREILLPANEQFVLAIDLERGETVIDPPPGLLELYLG